MERLPRKHKISLSVIIILTLGLNTCSPQAGIPSNPISRAQSLPADAIKISPENDPWPPAASSGWSQPLPLSGPVNTAGGEDSPYLAGDKELYFFFTPDVNIPASGQINDGVTGIWMSSGSGDSWTEPRRVMLIEPGKPHLDGCPFVMGEWMAFCSVREGNQREIDIYTADRVDGIWGNVSNWGEPINQKYRVGELHISADGYLYFGSDRPGGLGGIDLWRSRWNGYSWEEPVNLGTPINTPHSENRPFVSQDGQELWFDGPSRMGHPGPSVFRSVRQPDGTWGQPEEVISSFAGEPTLSSDGNTLLFIHHYFNEEMSTMIEADIFVSYRQAGTP